jgi:hypothetical protein
MGAAEGNRSGVAYGGVDAPDAPIRGAENKKTPETNLMIAWASDCGATARANMRSEYRR